MFYNKLLNEVYLYQNEGLVCVCGDIDSICRDVCDYMQELMISHHGSMWMKEQINMGIF